MTNKIQIQAVAAVDDAVRSLGRLNQSVAEVGDTATETGKVSSAGLDKLKGAAVATFGALVTGATASVKAASELQSSFSQIAALTDTPRTAIQGLTKDVIAMSREMPVSANELAKGLYYISSSGFKGAQAIDILRASAKAAASGLGETKTIADAVTSALNAYGLQGQDAARITDILTQAVKEGKGEPAELAGSLGRVLPIAAAAGVSMEQVAASMATMTRTGLSADEAATSLRGTIGALLAPSKQAKDALGEIGLTTADVAAKLKGEGLLSVLQMLMERTKGNVESLDAIIPNVRALTGVLSTAGSQGKEYADVLNKMAHAAGTTDKAFAEMSTTFESKLKKAQNALENLGIAVGNKLLPPLNDAADAAATLINWQDKLAEAEAATDKEVQQSAKTYEEYVNTMVAVNRMEDVRLMAMQNVEAGTITYDQAINDLALGMGSLTRAQFEVARGMDYADAGARGLSDQLKVMTKTEEEVEVQALATAEQIKAQAKATKEMNDKAAEAVIANSNFVESFKDFSAIQGAKTTISDLEQLIKDNPESRDKYASQIRAIKEQFGLITPSMEAGANSFRILESLWQSGSLSTSSYAEAMGKIKQAAADGKVSVDELGLKTGEAAAYMTASTTVAADETGRLVGLDKSNKQTMLDEMGNALEGQQTKLQGRISSSMLSISNSMTTAASLANTKSGEIKDAWDKVPREVTTTYNVKVNGTAPTGSGPGYASGANFIVPPGYPNDSFPMRVQSGERVIVQTPQQQAQQRIANMTMNVYTQSAPNVIDEFSAMRAMAGV